MSRTPELLGAAGGTMAILALLPAGPLPVAVAVGAGGALLNGRRRERPAHVTAGGVGLVAALVIAGLIGLSDGLLLVATVGAVVAWDAVENAQAIRAQVGTVADTGRAELVHLAATASVTAGLAGVVYFTSLVGRGRIPAATGIGLVGGAILIALALAPVGRAPD